MTKPAALVIGAGVIGLTTAVTLAETGHDVTVWTAEPPEETTSAVAAATWGPWMVEPVHRILPWAKRTLDALRMLARIPHTGVRLAAGREVSVVHHEPPEWAALLDDRRPCAPDDLPPGFLHGVRYTAPIIDMPIYLEYLAQRLRLAGGTLALNTISRIADVVDEAPIIVCCAGIGARTLASDNSLYPVRGQHLVVTNPGLTEFLEADTGNSSEIVAIYPHQKHAILAGTAEPNVWSRQPNPATAARILQRCSAIEPRLVDAKILGHRIGLRPTRPEIRLDAQQRDNCLLIHNYGHGGAGVSLSWGCAAEVRNLAGDHN